jgi:iron-sulfur cluster assembly protein
MKNAIMTMTDTAATRVCEIMLNHPDSIGIRVGLKKGGCAGMEYTVDLVFETPTGRADVIEHNGAKVFIASEAVLYLLGTEMDFEVSAIKTGFTFNNPNQTSACGCGESVSISAAVL